MRVGMVGLGRMGGNMSVRLLRRGHDVVGYTRSEGTRAQAREQGVDCVASLEALVQALEPPRTVWCMVPAGEPTESTVAHLRDLCEDGDLAVDGGNSNYRDSIRRAASLGGRGISFVDAGVSGGI